MPVGEVYTKELTHELAKRNITIVSGMARGVDAIAHEACIDAGGKTIAVLGEGFLKAQNKKLMSKILKNDGLIISEYFPDATARNFTYPKRNRIISGISHGVVVTEARLNSGTLITATHALEQNKFLFTFPASMDDVHFSGNNLILSKGAKCILNYNDILKYFPDKKFPKPSSKKIFKIPEEYKLIYSNIKKTPTNIAKIVSNIQLPFSEIQYKLTMMELEGYIEKVANDTYVAK